MACEFVKELKKFLNSNKQLVYTFQPTLKKHNQVNLHSTYEELRAIFLPKRPSFYGPLHILSDKFRKSWKQIALVRTKPSRNLLRSAPESPLPSPKKKVV